MCAIQIHCRAITILYLLLNDFIIYIYLLLVTLYTIHQRHPRADFWERVLLLRGFEDAESFDVVYVKAPFFLQSPLYKTFFSSRTSSLQGFLKSPLYAGDMLG
jgi:hypothetical protein